MKTMNQKHGGLIIFGIVILYTIGVITWEMYREDPHRFTKFFSTKAETAVSKPITTP